MVLLTIDEDEEASKASDYLAKNGYKWPNFHDSGELRAALGPAGIPRSILIDAQGKITYDRVGGDMEDLRGALSALGPEYASVARKQRQTPCK